MRRISIMLAKFRANFDSWDVVDWTILSSLLFPVTIVIGLAITDSWWWMVALPIPLFAVVGLLWKLAEHKYCYRRFLFVDFLADYLDIKQKYTELRKKHDLVMSAKNTKVI